MRPGAGGEVARGGGFASVEEEGADGEGRRPGGGEEDEEDGASGGLGVRGVLVRQVPVARKVMVVGWRGGGGVGCPGLPFPTKDVWFFWISWF